MKAIVAAAILGGCIVLAALIIAPTAPEPGVYTPPDTIVQYPQDWPVGPAFPLP